MKKNIAALILTLCIAVSAPLAGCTNAGQKVPDNPHTDKPVEDLATPVPEKLNDNYVGQFNGSGARYCDADFARIDYDAALREPCYYIADAPDDFIKSVIGKIGATSAKKQVKDKYGETYFEKYFVVVLRIPYSSGSTQTKLTNVTMKDGKIIIRLESVSPQFGTCDMATVAGLISLNKTAFEREAPLEIYLNDQAVLPEENAARAG